MPPPPHADCKVVCTCNMRCTLPADFIGACRTGDLSRLTTPTTHALPRHIWMVDTYDHRDHTSLAGLLQLNLGSLPDKLVQDILSSREQTYRAALFNLAVVHTSASFERVRGNELAPVHYSNLLTTVSRLGSLSSRGLEVTTVLHSLTLLVADLYSGCLTEEKCQAMAEGLLSIEVCSPGADIVPRLGTQLTVPPAAAGSLRELVEHVQSTAVDNTRRYIPYSWKFSTDLYFNNFVIQTKFVKYKTLKYFESITQQQKFVKFTSLILLVRANS